MSWKEIMKEEPVNNAELRELIRHQEFIVKAIRGYMENWKGSHIPQRHIEAQVNRAVAVLEFLKKLDLEHQSIDTDRSMSNAERIAQVKQKLDDSYPLPDEDDET